MDSRLRGNDNLIQISDLVLECSRIEHADIGVVTSHKSPSFPRKRESILNKEHRYFVYIMASKRHGTLYVGVTSRLENRAYEHRADLRKGFTKK